MVHLRLNELFLQRGESPLVSAISESASYNRAEFYTQFAHPRD
jgi:hypothetical protein